MTKILKSKYKASRRLGNSVWGNDKDPVHTKNYRPGQHGAQSRGKKSDFGLHLNEKQLVKSHYGRISERQFKNLFLKASIMKGNTTENFANLLERRLDMVVYRMNFAPTIFAARQLVSHKHILLNGKKVNIASISVKDGDVVELSESAKQIPTYMESAQKQQRSVPEYISCDSAKFTGKFVRSPMISDIPYPFQANFNKIIEFYSK